jgi:hypothetical protein
MKTLTTLSILLLILSACAGLPATPDPGQPVVDEPGTPPPADPFSPQNGDAALIEGPVYLDSLELLTLESYPLQFVLVLKGSLPTPCHQLRLTVAPPDEAGRIAVRAYSLADPETACIAVLEPFEASLPLGSFPAGHYQIVVNGEPGAEFDA